MKVGKTEGQESSRVLTDHEGNTARFISSTTDYGDRIVESTQVRVEDEHGWVDYGASKITYNDGTVETRILD